MAFKYVELEGNLILSPIRISTSEFLRVSFIKIKLPCGSRKVFLFFLDIDIFDLS